MTPTPLSNQHPNTPAGLVLELVTSALAEPIAISGQQSFLISKTPISD